MIFSPIYRAFREAAVSHATLARGKGDDRRDEGRFNVLEKGLSHKTRAQAARKRTLKRPEDYLRIANHAACAAWLTAAKRGKPRERRLKSKSRKVGE